MRRTAAVAWLGCLVLAVAALSAAPVRPAADARAAPAPDRQAAIRTIAARSQCATRTWKNRGRAPRSYVEGMALVYARSLCHPTRADVQIVSAPADLAPGADDGLAAYQAEFAALGLRNDAAGTDTLRHAYALLIGLGMMESGGRYCEGRDVSQCFTTADSAEAGLFQTSYGARRFSPALDRLFDAYRRDQRGCLLQTFKGALTCRIDRSHNPSCPDATSDVAGAGPGAEWQRLTKSCPAFAAEYAAVLLRRHGGIRRGEFGPIRRKQVELRPECDAMLREVEEQVRAHPGVCSGL